MSVEENKALVRHYFDELNKGNTEGAEDCLATGFVRYSVSGAVVNKTSYGAFLRGVAKSIPDLRRTVNEMIGEEDKVAIWFTWTGTHTGGVFGGYPPTGKGLVVQELYVARFEDGKIAEFRQFADLLGVFRQLGKSPPPPQPQ